MKTLLTAVAALVLASAPVQAAQDEYQQWLQQTRNDFQAYLDENDKAFIGFLKQRWQSVDLNPAQQRDPEPKPEEPPQAPQPQDKPQPGDTPVVTLPQDTQPQQPPQPPPGPRSEGF